MATVRTLLLFAPCLAATAALCDDSAALGKLRAAGSPLHWEVREANHPILGPIRFAFLTTPVATPVGKASVSSNAYVSCEMNRHRIAIELTNSTAPDDPGGLKPVAMPRLVCNRPSAGRIVQEPVDAHWQTNKLGDVLAPGLAPFPLRECIAIGVQEEVVLPKGWARKRERIEFEITPYARELDSIFATCGEPSAYAPAATTLANAAAPAAVKGAAPIASSSAAPTTASAATPTTASARAPTPAKPAAPKSAAYADAWKSARTNSNGITWVRSKPAPRAPIIFKLYPGDIVLVKEAGVHWWHIKSPRGSAFDGYVRRDRVVFE